MTPPDTATARASAVPATNSGPVLSVAGIRKSYGDRVAVDDVSFTVAPGECFGLLGPNGAGKTTSILMICGLIAADSGTVLVGSGQANVLSAAARAKIGYVPQEIALYEDMTATENLRFFGRLYGLRGKLLAERVSDMLEFVDLTDRSRDRVGTFSGGMKRRLNIATALLHEPELLVLDEPTVGVDPQSRNSILERLQELRDGGLAMIYTSHYMEEVERICTRIGIMDSGVILAVGTRQSLIAGLGDQVDTVRLTSSVSMASAVPALTAIPQVVQAADSEDGITLTVSGAAQTLPRILSAVAELDIPVTGISVDQASLETVFLSLTGKALRDG